LLIAGIIFLADLLIGTGLIPARLSALGIVGDLLLVEVGLLAILGGLVEFSRSKGVYEIRRTLDSKEEFSTAKHAEASRRAVVFFSSALALFLLLIALALIE